jgi:ABC-type antimicrobial peptide transport system permease subunit
MAVLGVGVGGFGTWAAGRLLESFLFGVSAQDPVSLAFSAAVLLGTTVLASWVPAVRASRTDPLETLKAE